MIDDDAIDDDAIEDAIETRSKPAMTHAHPSQIRLTWADRETSVFPQNDDVVARTIKNCALDDADKRGDGVPHGLAHAWTEVVRPVVARHLSSIDPHWRIATISMSRGQEEALFQDILSALRSVENPYPSWHSFSTEELGVAERLRLVIGHDDDSPERHQFTHVCWPFGSYEGALCKSSRLWMQGESIRKDGGTDCSTCARELAALTVRVSRAAKDDPFLDLMITMFNRIGAGEEVFTDVWHAAHNYLYALRNPEILTAIDVEPPYDPLRAFEDALEAADQHHAHEADARTERQEKETRTSP